jgi:hypothetical protein
MERKGGGIDAFFQRIGILGDDQVLCQSGDSHRGPKAGSLHLRIKRGGGAAILS